MFVAERQRWDQNCDDVDPESTSLLPLHIEEVAKAIMLADPTHSMSGTQLGHKKAKCCVMVGVSVVGATNNKVRHLPNTLHRHTHAHFSLCPKQLLIRVHHHL
jgi:hypothetical protein